MVVLPTKLLGLSSKSVSCPRKLGIQLAELGIFRQPSEGFNPADNLGIPAPSSCSQQVRSIICNIYHFVKLRNMLGYDTIELNADFDGYKL
jgi:hypothetical protein